MMKNLKHIVRSYLILMIGCIAINQAQAQKIVVDSVYMQNAGTIELWDNTFAALYSFTFKPEEPSLLPAKIIEVEEGDSVHIYAKSISNDGIHTIHLHGLDTDTENDGEPLTSFPIGPYNSYTYKFRATHAGTYIYHCHVGDVMHVQMGMYGLLIVKSKNNAKTAWTNGPAYDKTYSWLTSELDKFWHENTGNSNMNDFKVPIYSPSYFLINGKSQQQLADSLTSVVAEIKEKVYLRIANIGFYKNDFIFPAALNAEIIDSDGRPLPKSFKADTLALTPGERYGVMVYANSPLLEKIKVNFIDMNTQQIKGFEEIAVNITQSVGVFKSASQKKIFQISPNPARDQVNIKVMEQAKSGYDLVFKDMFGRIISTVRCQNNDVKNIDISNFAKGMYLIESNINNVVYSDRFIVQ